MPGNSPGVNISIVKHIIKEFFYLDTEIESKDS